MKKFFTSLILFALCLFTSCSTINGYRQDPSTWAKNKNKDKEVKTQKLTNNQSIPVTKETSTQTTPDLEAHTEIKEKKPVVETVKKLTPVTPPVVTAPVKIEKKERTIIGMIEPDVTKLPETKDLQESNTVGPAPPILPEAGVPLVPQLSDPAFQIPLNQ